MAVSHGHGDEQHDSNDDDPVGRDMMAPNDSKPLSVLIVHAHPEPSSFTAAMKDIAVAALTGIGHDVAVSDLYAQGFNPVVSRNDFTTVFDAGRFHYQAEQKFAAEQSGYAADIVREQDALMRADLLILTFPLWHFGPPAILKGWFERVISIGVNSFGRRFEEGLFAGRRAVMGVPTGGTTDRFSDAGEYGVITPYLRGIQRGVFAYLGFEAMDPFIAYAAPRITQDERVACLEEWRARIVAIASDPAWLAALDDRKAAAAKTAFFPERMGWATPG